MQHSFVFSLEGGIRLFGPPCQLDGSERRRQDFGRLHHGHSQQRLSCPTFAAGHVDLLLQRGDEFVNCNHVLRWASPFRHDDSRPWKTWIRDW